MRALICFFVFYGFVSVAQASPMPSADFYETAFRKADRFHTLDLASVPQWPSLQVMQERFEEIRDKRILEYQGQPRRIPWLFARDGCHNRAALFIHEAVQSGYAKPMRIFLFGVLRIESEFLPDGFIEPWFHSAPVVRVDGQVYVLDPTLDYEQPIALEDWGLMMTPDYSNVNLSLCSGDTYLPTTACDDPPAMDVEQVFEDAQMYLRFEWNILKYMGYDPADLLL